MTPADVTAASTLLRERTELKTVLLNLSDGQRATVITVAGENRLRHLTHACLVEGDLLRSAIEAQIERNYAALKKLGVDP